MQLGDAAEFVLGRARGADTVVSVASVARQAGRSLT